VKLVIDTRKQPVKQRFSTMAVGLRYCDGDEHLVDPGCIGMEHNLDASLC
jgi:hypothetical protein